LKDPPDGLTTDLSEIALESNCSKVVLINR